MCPPSKILHASLLAIGAFAIACAPSRPSTAPTTTAAMAAATTTSADVDRPARDADVAPMTRPQDAVDYTALAEADGKEVVRALEGDLLTCYRRSVADNPHAHASLVLDIVVDADGSVKKVDVSGGAPLGERAVQCISARVYRARFAPVHGGGTLRYHVPLTLETDPPDVK